MADKTELILIGQIEPLILSIRGQKVLLDRDLAELYGVPTHRLNEQVKRNRQRFPEDFMFQLTQDEFENWRSQIASSNSAVKMGLRRRPYAFTEHGAIMAATVLNSPRAVEVRVFVVRAFLKLRPRRGDRAIDRRHPTTHGAAAGDQTSRQDRLRKAQRGLTGSMDD
jgi:hypothetical protein